MNNPRWPSSVFNDNLKSIPFEMNDLKHGEGERLIIHLVNDHAQAVPAIINPK